MLIVDCDTIFHLESYSNKIQGISVVLQVPLHRFLRFLEVELASLPLNYPLNYRLIN